VVDDHFFKEIRAPDSYYIIHYRLSVFDEGLHVFRHATSIVVMHTTIK